MPSCQEKLSFRGRSGLQSQNQAPERWDTSESAASACQCHFNSIFNWKCHSELKNEFYSRSINPPAAGKTGFCQDWLTAFDKRGSPRAFWIIDYKWIVVTAGIQGIVWLAFLTFFWVSRSLWGKLRIALLLELHSALSAWSSWFWWEIQADIP